jgi:hypothetical protein
VLRPYFDDGLTIIRRHHTTFFEREWRISLAQQQEQASTSRKIRRSFDGFLSGEKPKWDAKE